VSQALPNQTNFKTPLTDKPAVTGNGAKMLPAFDHRNHILWAYYTKVKIEKQVAKKGLDFSSNYAII
jgi:hypothetical protein